MIRNFVSLSLACLLLVAVPACGGGGNGDPDAGHGDAETEDAGGEDAGGDDVGTDGGGDAGDTTAPVPGATGTLTVSNPTSSSLDLAWTAATDDRTAPGNLEYRVYYSQVDNLGTVADVLANGTPANEWTAGITSLTISSLSLGTGHAVNVLVRDEAGNVAAYEDDHGTTSSGQWQVANALETYTAGSVYYSTLAASPTGDVVAFWDQQPTWDVHFAVRGAADDGFDAELPWAATLMYTDNLTYDFDGRLIGASIRPDGLTSDVMFASNTPGEERTFEPVAEDLTTDYLRVSRACVSADDEVMVVWLEGTADDAFTVRARVRTGNTWGTPMLVSTAVDLNLYGLDVVCRPNGDHVILYGEDTGTGRVLNVRIYDASAGSFPLAAAPLSALDYQYEVVTALASDGRVVVAWPEYDDSDSTIYFRARTLTGDTWSAPATLADDDVTSIARLRLTAAGTSFHAVWTSGTELVTRTLGAGATAWSAEADLDVMDAYEYCLSGNAAGDAVLSWVSGQDVEAMRFSPSPTPGEWGDLITVFDGSTQIGSGSLACVMDARRRATVVYTVWDPDAMQFSAFERTYR